ncbi:excisionase [Pseudomonas sp. N3-W]|uniref:Excisionase n=1 Tax=Pseudomonas fungipugnans TaxID=3024217 RepID=A0ABT6QZ32_9PSED|nr:MULTISPECIES: excisionase [unclassified Pseudomonas]MDI2595559.1 excisionase [Pseudomonas sp. 681]UWF46931.1 excisionase [Pseudomonas sp. N3-W]
MSKVTLDEWAAAEFKTPPSPNTLRKWAREGRIAPAPIKHGRSYYVESDAHYKELERQPVRIVGGSLISRIERARNGAEAA